MYNAALQAGVWSGGQLPEHTFHQGQEIGSNDEAFRAVLDPHTLPDSA